MADPCCALPCGCGSEVCEKCCGVPLSLSLLSSSSGWNISRIVCSISMAKEYVSGLIQRFQGTRQTFLCNKRKTPGERIHHVCQDERVGRVVVPSDPHLLTIIMKDRALITVCITIVRSREYRDDRGEPFWCCAVHSIALHLGFVGSNDTFKSISSQELASIVITRKGRYLEHMKGNIKDSATHV